MLHLLHEFWERFHKDSATLHKPREAMNELGLDSLRKHKSLDRSVSQPSMQHLDHGVAHPGRIANDTRAVIPLDELCNALQLL